MNDLEPGTFTATFTQSGDTCSSRDFQGLTIKIIDDGGGPYYVIETEEWAFDTPEEAVALLNRVRNAYESLKENDAHDADNTAVGS